VPELGPTESQNRFNRVFQQFIYVFSNLNTAGAFPDDLQWVFSLEVDSVTLL